jgi:two-component system, LytTR family, response regulator
MDNITVLIIEDNPAESAALIRVLEAHQYTIAGVAGSHQEALTLFHSSKIDIVVIDVFLNGVPDGIAFAETIQALPDRAKPFVFLTSSTDRAIFERARLTRPFSFLMKPFNELEVIYAMEMALEKFYDQGNAFFRDEQPAVLSKDFLFIKKNDSLKKVQIAAILYIEVEERYCTIHAENEKFVVLMSLTRITELLDASRFSRTHRNFIVNLEKIEEIQPADNLILLTGNRFIPMSPKYKDFLHRFRLLK